MFGGANDQMKKAFSDIWVLSLPSFTWSFVAEFPPSYEREGHACVIAGRSQLLTWGGLPYHISDNVFESEDPLPQGVVVFDLNRLSSQSPEDLIKFDANAEPYRAEDSLAAALVSPASMDWDFN